MLNSTGRAGVGKGERRQPTDFNQKTFAEIARGLGLTVDQLRPPLGFDLVRPTPSPSERRREVDGRRLTELIRRHSAALRPLLADMLADDIEDTVVEAIKELLGG